MTASSIATEEESQKDEASLPVNILKELAQKALVDALNAVSGAKTLVLDATLAGPLGLVTEVALLKHHGVDKMFWLELGPLTASTANIVYLCRPLIKNIKIVADQVKRHSRDSQNHVYTLLLVPRTSTLVTRILEEEGILGDVTVAAYNLQFIPIADDVISLENDDAFKELYADGDETIIFDSAQALYTLQQIYGSFPRVIGKGDAASRLATLLIRQAQSSAGPSESLLTTSEKFDSLIILDRRVDIITPLLTQLTYEGLVDELIGIKNSHVELPASLLAPPVINPNNPSAPAAASTSGSAASLNKEKRKRHHLTPDNDPLFTELRDLNFAAVGKRLSGTAHRLDEDYKARLQTMSVPQLREFVGKLGGLQTVHQSLRLHTGLSEMLVPMTRTEEFNKSLEIQQNLLASYDIPNQIAAIEDLIAQGADMQVVVRLICLASVTAGGIKSKALDNLKREVLQTYGYNLLPLLLLLAAPSLSLMLPNPLPPSTPASIVASKYPFTSLRKSLRLLIDDNPEALDEVENDISFTYSGYAPISIRLVQCVAQKGGVISNPAEKEKSTAEDADGKGKGKTKGPPSMKVQAHPIVGWKGFEDVLSTIPGETFDIVQKGHGGESMMQSKLSLIHREQSTTTVVFFLGGCTYTEIAALRWVGRQNRGRKFLVATTSVISGASLVEGLAGVGRATQGSRDAGI